jgi:predicted glycosyltransferase
MTYTLHGLKTNTTWIKVTRKEEKQSTAILDATQLSSIEVHQGKPLEECTVFRAERQTKLNKSSPKQHVILIIIGSLTTLNPTKIECGK